jgi:hypothetical protein
MAVLQEIPPVSLVEVNLSWKSSGRQFAAMTIDPAMPEARVLVGV